jgi:uncharacterized protein (TIGR03083 family)
MTDWADVYRSNVDAVIGLAEGLSAEQLSLRVPATPDWDVHDVLAHLAGSPADALSGRMDGAPSAEWTGRHVGERSARTVDELVAEIRDSVDDVVAALEGNDSPALVWNASVHHADLHEALDLGVPPEPMWRPVLEGIAPRVLRDNAAALEDVPDYELFRALFSRRSRSQMAGWGASVDPGWLDSICLFGPRDDDQPVPERGRSDPA